MPTGAAVSAALAADTIAQSRAARRIRIRTSYAMADLFKSRRMPCRAGHTGPGATRAGANSEVAAAVSTHRSLGGVVSLLAGGGQAFLRARRGEGGTPGAARLVERLLERGARGLRHLAVDTRLVLVQVVVAF